MIDDPLVTGNDSDVSRKSSTSKTDREFATPVKVGDRFQNPTSFATWTGLKTFSDIFKWRFFETDNENVPTDAKILDKTIPVRPLTSFDKPASGSMCATWLGHATVLVHMDGANFITDPIWSHRASFLQWIGPKRYRPPPMKIEDLPKLDFGVISHDHYDHLDSVAVQKITEANENIKWFVPLGMKEWLKGIGVGNSDVHPDRVTEMSWGDRELVTFNEKQFKIWCVPAQHWGRRGLFDTNKRLWCGWAVRGPEKRFYYTGDTGFCEEEFKTIGQRLGPFDLAAIPIGAYEPRWFMMSQHINPDDAVQIHKHINSKMSLGIHWGTYHMGTYEYYLEPKERLAQLMAESPNLNPFVTMDMGTVWHQDDNSESEDS